MAEDHEGSSKDGQAPPPPVGGNGALGEQPELDRLPPPAFPPGERGTHSRRRLRTPAEGNSPAQSGGREAGDAGVPDEAFISPDEPIERTGSRIAADAFISPDAPLPDRGPEQGVVTGIDDDPHLDESDWTSPRFTDPHVAELVLQVGRLADALQGHGEAGLRTTADMSRFEATLRAYCVGYLVAQRETGTE